ncbi:SNF2-related protein [Massilia sp. TWP1-3-3]|uniref:DEAD/DEAH box helicase n=1 Tax=Massilia sp. TWP1-3-3 TaxID=2804573 RepID=UPI003CF03689
MQFSLNDILRHYDRGTYSRGHDYAQRGKVRALAMVRGVIQSEVSGSGGHLYRQSISFGASKSGVVIDGDCSCPMQSNCKHVVAALLAYLDREPFMANEPDAGPVVPQAMSAWLQQVEQMQKIADKSAAKPKKVRTASLRLLFVLQPDHIFHRIDVRVAKAKMDDGKVVSATLFGDSYSLLRNTQPFVRAADRAAVALLVGMANGGLYASPTAEVHGEDGARFLRQALDGGALAWADEHSDLKTGNLQLLEQGPARAGQIAWISEGEHSDSLRLDWQFTGAEAVACVLPTVPPMYVHGGRVGEFILPDSARTVPIAELQALLLHAPPVSPRDRDAVARRIVEQGLGLLLPAPPNLQNSVRSDIAPLPVLWLGSIAKRDPHTGQTGWDDYAVLGFDYDGERAGPAGDIHRHTAAGFETIVRDMAREAAAAAMLADFGFSVPAALKGMRRLAHLDAWMRFAREQLPLLREAGWEIEQDPSFRFDLTEVDDWYADVEQGDEGGSAWFDLELGIVVNGSRVALMPLLLQLIGSAPHEFNPAALEAHPDHEQLLAQLPDGVRVALPWGRIKPILRTLGELYFTDHVGSTLRLSALDAARLAELEASARLRWAGGAQLRALGHKLRDFKGVQAVAAPAGLQASLRAYQFDGLAWMQFLREFGMAGILADDMGLGKTVQTLAHILVEKEAGRLTSPALVVAPTSLMGNWQAEAARFAPGLRVLLLHGAERQQHFAHIGQYDLVLTTYALLARDETQLRAQRFHLLILDESQYIKNSRAKAAQTAALLVATHRLCLTGTPLQNHLGELWSQFHFLMPGLLGEEKAFNANYRKPIEKLGDASRKDFLVRRIKPFLLRRTKDAVAKELPAKTEMVREVELTGLQRDLYETVRLAMDKKVRDAIASKGVARSQIVILDALLKLRQVCCDPRLVKIAGKKGAPAPSAKLVELMDMIVELLDEGRKILVFSQFTSMLALIEDELRARAIAYALLTGETRDRTGQVAAFQRGDVPLFLISLKAGGVGLNLTAADTVIHYDPWWNPAAENQATDRAWRIGQDKPVFVYKLIARGTLEQKIQELQRKKADLADAVLDGGASQNLALTQDDLQAILAPLHEQK